MTPNFDRIARVYRWLEYATLGRLLERTRLYHLPALTGRRLACLLGDGDGRFIAALLDRYPTLQAHAVDLSPCMIALLRGRTPSSRLTTTVADALTFTPHPSTDLLVTHFFLDCLTQPQADTLIARLGAHSAPDTLWLVSDFQPAPGLLRFPSRLYIRALYLAFRILTGLRVTRVPDYATPLQHAGFRLLSTKLFAAGLLTTTLWRRKHIQPPMTEDPVVEDPQSDPEPASPSLETPDPAVYHHEVAPTTPPQD